MFKTTVVLTATLALSACGGARYDNRNLAGNVPIRVIGPDGATTTAGEALTPVAVALPFARGPIQKACEASDRRARSSTRCGCIQAVADQSLSAAQQRRGARYWTDPGKLQEVRQSDNPANERFWKAWKAYGQSAAAVCSNS